MKKDEAVLRKRAQISKANRTMFFWVAGMSVIVGFALVVSIFLFQRMVFNQGIISEKQKTAATLKRNIEALESLKQDVTALNSNAVLMGLKASPDDSALQVVLDALPAQANSLALGASIQDRLLNGLNLKIVSLDVEEAAEATDGSASPTASTGEASTGTLPGTVQPIAFSLVVSAGDPEVLRELLLRFERSIRTINVRSLKIEQSGSETRLVISASAFYQPEKVAEIREEERSMSKQ